MLDSQSLPCLGLGQPGRICARTASAAAAKVGMLLRRRFSTSGSPPARANQRLAAGERGEFGLGELVAFLYASSFPREQWRRRVYEALTGLDLDGC